MIAALALLALLALVLAGLAALDEPEVQAVVTRIRARRRYAGRHWVAPTEAATA